LEKEKKEEECLDLNSAKNSILTVQEEMNLNLKLNDGKKKLLEIQRRIDSSGTISIPTSPLGSPLPRKKNSLFPSALKTKSSSNNFKLNSQVNIIQPYRIYIYSGDLKLIPDYGIESKKGEQKQFFLFSDSVMVCEEDEKQNLKYEELTSLITVPLPWVRDISLVRKSTFITSSSVHLSNCNKIKNLHLGCKRRR
jgi:hypothetical protein